MEFKRVIVLHKCISVIRAESRKAWGIETGGPLVGYRTKDAELVVSGACGPGPNSKMERYTVIIDGVHAQKFCDQMLQDSDGLIDYVGDWHKHPGFSLKPSGQDALAMKTMADFEYSPTKYPISLIYRALPEAFHVYVWDGSGSLIRIPSKMSKTHQY